MAQAAKLLYRIVQWNESFLQSAGKRAAGPLFDIRCSDNAVSQLHLPHCGTQEALLVGGLLSVMHITDDGMNILEPLKINNTHVAVEVHHLSAFGLVWDSDQRFQNIPRPVNAQVLLFLRPQYERHRVLDVFLLPANIPVNEVAAQQKGAENIKTSSKCTLISGERYSLHCEREDFVIQPHHAPFYQDFGPNFHPSFEVVMTTNPRKVTLMVQDQKKREVWRRVVDLTGLSTEIRQTNVQKEDAVERLLSLRTGFIQRVSGPALDHVMDHLLERHVLSDYEMDSIRSVETRQEKARLLIDMVRKKGPKAGSILITALCEVDPFLSEALGLI